jgi:hypothetical protein
VLRGSSPGRVGYGVQLRRLLCYALSSLGIFHLLQLGALSGALGCVCPCLTCLFLLQPLGRLEQRGRHLGRIDRDAGEAWVEDRMAFDDQLVLWVLNHLGNFLPLLLANKD